MKYKETLKIEYPKLLELTITTIHQQETLLGGGYFLRSYQC